MTNSRRLIVAPEAHDGHHSVSNLHWERRSYVRFGSKADICTAPAHVRFTPNSDRESRHPQTVMSALPPKADMFAENFQSIFRRRRSPGQSRAVILKIVGKAPFRLVFDRFREIVLPNASKSSVAR